MRIGRPGGGFPANATIWPRDERLRAQPDRRTLPRSMSPRAAATLRLTWGTAILAAATAHMSPCDPGLYGLHPARREFLL
jgi:hypothetical protein